MGCCPSLDALNPSPGIYITPCLATTTPRPTLLAGNTPLHFAAALNSPRAAKLLLLHGAPPNARNAAGKSPLLVAVDAGARAVAAVLLPVSDVNLPGAYCCVSVLLSSLSCASECDVVLLTVTVLHHSVLHCMHPVPRLPRVFCHECLFVAGTTTDREGVTPLLSALHAGRRRYMHWLLDGTAAPDCDARWGWGGTVQCSAQSQPSKSPSQSPSQLRHSVMCCCAAAAQQHLGSQQHLTTSL